MNPPELGRLRVQRGAFRPRGVRWRTFAVSETGSTNTLWRGSSPSDEWLLKWYRYPLSGVHPEAEIANFLSKQGFRGAAEFGARVDAKKDGAWQTVAFIQRWVDGFSMWEKAVAMMRDGAAGDALARDLGRAVGKLHTALSSGAADSEFGRKPWVEEARTAWRQRLTAGAQQLDEALEGSCPAGMPQEMWKEAQRTWAKAGASWYARVEYLAALNVEGEISRIHGDLHLGQILERKVPVDGERFVFVDMEGEPTRTTEARRAKDLPLRDVAGMWRSFAYAAAVAGAGGDVAELWSQAFLEGWAEKMPPPSGNWQALLEGLVWEKTVYEALYEIRHRPDWLWIPMQGLSKSRAENLAGDPDTAF